MLSSCRDIDMRLLLSRIYPLIFILGSSNAVGVGKAWRVLPYGKIDYWDHPSWPRLDTSAFEVRTVSGVGRLVPLEDTKSIRKEDRLLKSDIEEPNELPKSKEPYGVRRELDISSFEDYKSSVANNIPYKQNENFGKEELDPPETTFKTGVMMRVLEPKNDRESLKRSMDNPEKLISRLRREAENETKMEKIATTKNVREVRLSSPETWSTQPISVEFRHRTSLDQMIQQAEDDEDGSTNIRSHHVPRADFVTSHHRRSYPDNRESRDMPVTRNYEDYDVPWYKNAIRERDYDPPSYRRGLSYYYPDRYRMERDYYSRTPNDPSYYYDRYREDDFDLYGRSRPAPKPKRIIYYATLPEIVRKPVDLRNYPRPYDGLMRSPVSRDGTYKRIPGNVDPSRYRYRHLYDGYDSYSKRSSFFDRPYGYSEEDSRRKGVMKESLRNNDGFDQNNDRKLSNQISVRDDGKLPWPVQIGTEVSVKSDERIPGRKIFGESGGYERFQSAQLQKAPDATGSSELQSDN